MFCGGTEVNGLSRDEALENLAGQVETALAEHVTVGEISPDDIHIHDPNPDNDPSVGDWYIDVRDADGQRFRITADGNGIMFGPNGMTINLNRRINALFSDDTINRFAAILSKTGHVE